jgi:hypothetical protein
MEMAFTTARNIQQCWIFVLDFTTITFHLQAQPFYHHLISLVQSFGFLADA